MVLIPYTTGVESANTNVIGRRSPVARDFVLLCFRLLSSKRSSNAAKTVTRLAIIPTSRSIVAIQ